MSRWNGQTLLAGAAGLTLCAMPVNAADSGAQGSEDPDAAPARTLFAHPEDTAWWLSGQANLISQAHPGFQEDYHGTQSLSSKPEGRTSYVATLYAGYRLTSTTDAILDIEATGGQGFSQTYGLGGFTNLDTVRNPTLGHLPYVARAELHQVIPLSDEMTAVDRGALQFAPRLPVRRIEIRAGKMSTVDSFDQNGPGTDSHLQFMNWTVDNNGAYDYAADTRGYTLGAIIEFQDRRWGARFGELLMPSTPNGSTYDTDVRHARGENLELELRPGLLKDRASVFRLLGYLNHAKMSSYSDAIKDFQAGRVDPNHHCDPGTDLSVPELCGSRVEGHIKAGVGLNFEQELTRDLRVFGRAGYSDGRDESFAYTEVDDTLELGGDLRGTGWRRPGDKLGLAAVTNGLSSGHREYLALGGHGFLLGDGRLTYGRESIVEGYYTALLWRGLSIAADVQGILNPGFNRDRGPVLVGSVRVHLEI